MSAIRFMNAARSSSMPPVVSPRVQPVAVAEMKVARQHGLREGDVALHDGGFDLTLEVQDLRGVTGRVRGGSLRQALGGLRTNRQAGDNKRNE